MIEDKIKRSVELIKSYEELALKLNPSDGFYLAFSGGKDSRVIYELCKMAEVKYKAHFSCTTIDPKEVLRFIHEKYPDVIWHRPEKSMFKLIEENKCLPTSKIRFCCKLIKEVGGIGNVVILGVRAAESRNRAKRSIFEHHCVNGDDKLVLKPIFNWSHSDVWKFIREYIGFYSELYDRGLARIGCVFCPMSPISTKQKYLLLAPRFKYAFLKSIEKCMTQGNYSQFNNAEDVFNWWLGGGSVKKYFAQKNQLKLYEPNR